MFDIVQYQTNSPKIRFGVFGFFILVMKVPFETLSRFCSYSVVYPALLLKLLQLIDFFQVTTSIFRKSTSKLAS